MTPSEDFLYLGANYSLRINRTTSWSRVGGKLSVRVGSEITARLEIWSFTGGV